MPLIRAFLAVELPDEITSQLSSTIQAFKSRRVQCVRWVAVENIHLTLKFLGDVSTTNLHSLAELIRTACKEQTPFEIEVTGAGAFPNIQRPRVIWVGLQAPPALNHIHTVVEEAASRIKVPREERGFSPHLTLGRVKNDASVAELQQLSAYLKNLQVGSLGRFTVNQLTLFRSVLRPQGALYTVLEQFEMAGGR